MSVMEFVPGPNPLDDQEKGRQAGQVAYDDTDGRGGPCRGPSVKWARNGFYLMGNWLVN